MLWSRRLAFVIGCALLASCGGGDGGSPPATGGGGTPTPTPTPSPSPTPTYSTVAQLTGNQQFEAGCAFFNFSRQISPNFSAFSDNPFSERNELRFAAATSTWTFVESAQTNPADQRTFAFAPADLVASPPANTTLYRRTVGTGSHELRLQGAQQTGFVTDYTRALALSEIAVVGSADSQRNDRLCVYGVPTVAADTFPAGSVSYTSLNVAGTATVVTGGVRQRTFSLTDSTATLSVNGQAGTVAMSIQLVGREILSDGSLATTTTTLPALTAGTGTISNAGTPSIKVFAGNFTTGGFGLLQSQFAGAFFGPQGREAGFTFTTGPFVTNSSISEVLEVAGIVIARR